MIVDDEVLVRIGLKNTISWERIGFEVVGEAANGEVALELYEELLPDVIITDIKMPKKDGLWLTEKIHERNKHAVILVLTCYDEFQYARKALKNGAYDYLLKSEIVDDELIELMLKIKKEIDENHVESQGTGKKPVSQRASKRTLMNDLIRVNFNLDEGLRQRLQEQNMKEKATRYGWIYFKMGIQLDPKVHSIGEATINLAFDLFKQKQLSYLYNGYDTEHLFLIEGEKLTLNQLHRLSVSIQSAVSQYFGVNTHMIYSDAEEGIEGAGRAYEQLMDAKRMTYYLSHEVSYLENASHVKWEKVSVRTMKKAYGPVMIDILGRAASDEIATQLSDIYMRFREEHYKPKYLKLLMVQLIEEAYNVYPFAFESITPKYSLSDHQNLLLATTHVAGLSDEVERFYQIILTALTESRGSQSSMLVSRAVHYIQNHFHENISLEDVAKVVNLSKQYLCHIFKKETGKNLSAFINELRINKAKQLLLNQSYSNKDIYEKVGFSNQQYFSRVFKKMTHMTTSEYREKMIINHQSGNCDDNHLKIIQ